MKFDNLQSSSVEIIGDIKENKVGIRAEDAEHLIMVLSSNLYSDPVGSTVREIVSNAWDAHVEAGNTDPVIITFYKTMENTFQVMFQDFGVGLSPERFDSVYKNIGASTKRNSNGQIGGFGIGKFAPLSYTNMITIISNFEGMQYLYIIHKDGTSVSIDLITESETQEPNGVTIQLNLEQEADLPKFTKSILRQLAFFENIHIEDRLMRTAEELTALELSRDTHYSDYINKAQRDIKTFNTLKIKKFENFAINSGLEEFSKSSDVIIGRVRYPLDLSQLSFDVSSLSPETIEVWREVQGDDFSALAHLNPPISLICQVGELNITPNREQILYSKLTKDILSNKYVLAIAEFIKTYKHEITGEFTNLKKYLEALWVDRNFNLFQNEESYLSYKFPKEFNTSITLKGETISKFEAELMTRMLDIKSEGKFSTENMSIQDAFLPVGYLINGTFTQNRIPNYHRFQTSQKFTWFFNNKSTFIILDKPFSSLNQLEKYYFKSLGQDVVFINIKSFTYKHFINYTVRKLQSTYTTTNEPLKLRKIKDVGSDFYNNLDGNLSIKLKNKLLFKYYYTIATRMLRFVISSFKKGVVLHNISNIPPEIELEYKEEIKQRRLLADRSVYNESISIEESLVSDKNLSNNNRTVITEKPYTEKISVLVEKANKGKMYIHYDKNNQSDASLLKSIGYWFLPMLPKSLTFISVAPTKRKLLTGIHKNIISIEDMMQESKIMKNIVTALYIMVKYPELPELYSTNRVYIQLINEDLFNKLEEISLYFQYKDAIGFKLAFKKVNGTNYMMEKFKTELLEKGMADNIYHLAVKKNFDEITPILKKLFPVMDLFRVKKGSEFGSIPMASMPILIDFLHRNKVIDIPLKNLISARLEVKTLLNNNS